MKKIITLAAALLALGASSAMAQGGLNLYWDGCSDGGVATKTFACNANTGTVFTMNMTAILPTAIAQLSGTTGIVDVRVDGGTLPAWWQVNSGDCRANAVGMSFDPNGNLSNCFTDCWGGANPTAVFAVQPLRLGPDHVRFNGAAALPAGSEIPLAADGTEYWIGKVTITRAKSTGTGACDGCLVPACIVFNESKFQTPLNANDVLITNEATNRWVTWNGPATNCPASTPATNRTWGAVKSLYR